MMSRKEITATLKRYAFAAEVTGDDRVDGKAIAGALWGLRSIEEDLADLHAQGGIASHRQLPKAMKTALVALLDGEPLPFADELEAQVPDGVFDLQQVKGLGAKKIRQLWHDLDVTDLSSLAYACQENRLLTLKGFGEKTQNKVLDQLATLQQNAKLRRLDHAMALSAEWCQVLGDVDGVVCVVEAGDVARRQEVARSLHVVVAVDDDVEVMLPALADHLDQAGALDVDVVEELWLEARLEQFPLRIDVVFEEDLAPAVVWHTSDAEQQQALSTRATAKGGRFQDGELLLQGANVASEDDVYAALGLVPVPAERREGAVLVEQGTSQPRLLQRNDIQGALHNHTTASDGMNTLEQMHAAASAMGLRYLGISEHSESAVYAGGLTAAGLDKQRSALDALNAKGEGAVLLASVESDILPDGSLDYDAGVLDGLHHVIASVHARGRLDRDGFTARMVAAASSPHTDIIGHPTGRLILGRAPSDYDVEAFLDACAASGTAVELNANPARLDFNERHLAAAKERGIVVSVSADAHSVEALHHLDYGVAIARRAGLTPDDVLNCWDVERLNAWLRSRRERASV